MESSEIIAGVFFSVLFIMFVIGILSIVLAPLEEYPNGPKGYRLRILVKNNTRCYIQYTKNGWIWKKIPLSVTYNSIFPRINYYELMSQAYRCEEIFNRYKGKYYELQTYIEDSKISYRKLVDERNVRIFESVARGQGIDVNNKNDKAL